MTSRGSRAYFSITSRARSVRTARLGVSAEVAGLLPFVTAVKILAAAHQFVPGSGAFRSILNLPVSQAFPWRFRLNFRSAFTRRRSICELRPRRTASTADCLVGKKKQHSENTPPL